MTTGKTIAMTRQTYFGKVMSLLFNMLSRVVQTQSRIYSNNHYQLFPASSHLCSPLVLDIREKKVLTNLDNILKSRDITLPTKVHIVKAMFFPVMYGCESWTIKKAEHSRIDAFELWCWSRL